MPLKQYEIQCYQWISSFWIIRGKSRNLNTTGNYWFDTYFFPAYASMMYGDGLIDVDSLSDQQSLINKLQCSFR